MRGVFPILIMPYDEQGRIDEESLRSEVEFNIKAGLHGLGLAMGSEVLKLTEPERARVTKVIVDQAKGRVPVVINSSGTGPETAAHLSRMAEEHGADALMVTPPIVAGMGGAASPANLLAHFRAVNAAVHIPIFIQSAASPVSAPIAKQLAQECEHIRYLKEEGVPAAVRVAEAVQGVGDALVVFGGAGGSFFVEEMLAGAQGTMPSASQPEDFVRVWDLFQAGDVAGARKVHTERIERLNRLFNLSRDGFFHINKELLRQRGVIRTAVVRAPVEPFHDIARRELQALIDEFYG